MSIKTLALKALAESKIVPPSVSGPEKAGTEQNTAHQANGQSPAACGSLCCAGCYDVGDRKKIHPPRCSQNWQAKETRLR